MNRYLLTFLSFPLALNGQSVPGTNLDVSVGVAFAAMTGDTAQVQYVLTNSSASTEQLFWFIVLAPNAPRQVSTPVPSEDWAVDTDFRSLPVGMWTILGDEVAPGQSSPILRLDAIGLVGIVDAWYRGFTPPPPLPDSFPTGFEFDPLIDGSVSIRTIGVESIGNSDPGSLLTRLDGLLQEACVELQWVSANECLLLAEIVAAADEAVTGGRVDQAKEHLDSFLSQLSTGFDAGVVNDAGFWLLSTNASFIQRRLPEVSVSFVSTTADTYLKRGTPNKNQGADSILRIRQSGKNRALLRFDDAAFTGVTGQVVSAHLEVDIVFNADNWGTTGRTIDAHRMLVPWSETGATWRCGDDSDPTDSSPDCGTTAWEMQSLSPSPFDPTASGTVLITKELTGVVSIDVTDDVRAIIAGQASNFGWILKKTQEGQAGHIQLGTRESGAPARLVIEVIN